MSQNTLGNALGEIINGIEKDPRHDTGQNEVVFEAEQHTHRQEGKQGEAADRYRVEISLDQVAQQP